MESGLISSAADSARAGGGGGGRAGGREGHHDRKRIKSEHGDGDTVPDGAQGFHKSKAQPDAAQVAAAAAVVYQAVLEQVVVV